MPADESKYREQEASLPDGPEPGEVQHARRKFVTAAAAAPVVLAVSGRSALASDACQPIPKGLSPMAWLSIHPRSGSTVCLSHTVGSSALGRSPGYWTPNKNGSTFQGPWPSSVIPFAKLNIGKAVVWNPNQWKSYSDLPYDYDGKDAGWNTGTKLTWLDGTRSVSRILIDESGTLKWHVCAAYLNSLVFPDYALTPTEVQQLYETRKLAKTGYVLTDGEIKDFLDQSWT